MVERREGCDMGAGGGTRSVPPISEVECLTLSLSGSDWT